MVRKVFFAQSSSMQILTQLVWHKVAYLLLCLHAYSLTRLIAYFLTDTELNRCHLTWKVCLFAYSHAWSLATLLTWFNIVLLTQQYADWEGRWITCQLGLISFLVLLVVCFVRFSTGFTSPLASLFFGCLCWICHCLPLCPATYICWVFFVFLHLFFDFSFICAVQPKSKCNAATS